ncbi:MAG TPA: lytic transglycosylase domain-containing protein [Acetobacteraceae bacterium]|nr:lytic transglycosylase domain-containing protein [Acetobacteraceae bacterium]
MGPLRLALLLCLAAGAARADLPAAPLAQAPGLLCRAAIAAAARAHGVPPGLMAAVGRVESGRRDPVSGAWYPWPWTVDADGQGTFYDTKAQAIAAVRALQASGGHSIDVGCMQVNLQHHPHAFATPEQAFDPGTNADYAARFLVELRGQSGSWPQATALYHSATPAIGAAYEQKVMAAWPEEQRLAGEGPVVASAGNWGSPFNGGLFAPPPRREAGARFVPPALPGQAPPPGRGLDAYRAAPIMLGWRRKSG